MLLNKDNFCYKTHHFYEDTENSKARKYLKNHVDSYLNKYGTELKTKTIYFKDIESTRQYFLDNKDINICWYGYNYNSENVSGWKIGDIGLIVSNYIAWQEFLNSSFDYFLLMEDDLILEDDFFESLNFYINNLPDDWELFSIYRTSGETDQYKKYHDINNKIISKTYAIRSNACYLINKKFVNKITNNIKIDKPLDVFLLDNNNIISYSLNPDISSKCFVAPLSSTYQYQNVYSRDFFKLKCTHLHE